MKTKFILTLSMLLTTIVFVNAQIYPTRESFGTTEGADTVQIYLTVGNVTNYPVAVDWIITPMGETIPTQSGNIQMMAYRDSFVIRNLQPGTTYDIDLILDNHNTYQHQFTTQSVLVISETDLQKVHMFVSDEQLNLTLPESLQNKPIVIRNMLGQVQLPVMQSQGYQTIDMLNVPHGIYLVSIGDYNNQVTRKIIW